MWLGLHGFQAKTKLAPCLCLHYAFRRICSFVWPSGMGLWDNHSFLIKVHGDKYMVHGTWHVLAICTTPRPFSTFIVPWRTLCILIFILVLIFLITVIFSIILILLLISCIAYWFKLFLKRDTVDIKLHEWLDHMLYDIWNSKGK